ncbi:MAG: adenosine kinase [Bacteroidota bacterium]|nr:adenosine kinase [Bacteroidota bacterium]
MDKVIGLGNALVDIIAEMKDDSLLEKFSLPKGSMQLVDGALNKKILKESEHLKQSRASGGSAANTIHGLARLGVETGFIGKIGDDEIGEFFKNDMIESHINPVLISGKTETGIAAAMISTDAERTFATFLGAAVELSAQDIKESFFSDYNVLHIEGYLVLNNELLEGSLKLAKKAGLTISLDLASYNVVEDNLSFLQEMVAKYVDIVFANEEEAKAFTGFENPQKALEKISESCDIAVVKVGKKGSLVKKGDEIYTIEINPVKSIDTTGAGDLYAAGFLYGFINNMSMTDCGFMGSLLSSKVIQVIGAKISEEDWIEINKQKLS